MHIYACIFQADDQWERFHQRPLDSESVVHGNIVCLCARKRCTVVCMKRAGVRWRSVYVHLTLCDTSLPTTSPLVAHTLHTHVEVL